MSNIKRVDARRDGETEQDSEKRGEKKWMSELEELHQQVHPDDERCGAQDVRAAESRRALSSRTIGVRTRLDRRWCRIVD